MSPAAEARPFAADCQSIELNKGPLLKARAARTMGADDFVYNAEHRVVVCVKCGTCLAPNGPKNWKNHLGRAPHFMKGRELRRTVELLSTFDLRGRMRCSEGGPAGEHRAWRSRACESIRAISARASPMGAIS